MSLRPNGTEQEEPLKIEYRKQYIQNLQGAFHTLSGLCDFCDVEKAENEVIVKTCYPKKARGKDYYEYYLQVNPNKTVPGSMIKKYSDFQVVLQQALERMEACNFRVTRADFCFNSDNVEDYELFKKLNRLLICCIADAENVKNCYKTYDLWSDKSLSVAIKNDRIEAENYDKSIEDPNVETKNRLEIRSKRMNGKSLQDEFQENWFKRLDKALERFENVQERYNQELYRLWMQDLERSPKTKLYTSLTAFLLQYKDCIYTRKQLEKFLELIGVEHPKRKAKNFKDRHTIEFYSKTDLQIIVAALKKVILQYLSN